MGTYEQICFFSTPIPQFFSRQNLFFFLAPFTKREPVYGLLLIHYLQSITFLKETTVPLEGASKTLTVVECQRN